MILITRDICDSCKALKEQLDKAGESYIEIKDEDFFAGRIPQEVSANVRSKIMADLQMGDDKALPIVYDADGVRKGGRNEVD